MILGLMEHVEWFEMFGDRKRISIGKFRLHIIRLWCMWWVRKEIKVYEDVNKKVKEKEGVYKRKRKRMFRHKNWSRHCATKEKEVVEKKRVKQNTWV